MGDAADDIIQGYCCQLCSDYGPPGTKPRGYAFVCKECQRLHNVDEFNRERPRKSLRSDETGSASHDHHTRPAPL